MTPHPRAHAALAAISWLALVLFLAVALARLGHPYELEWIEGGMRDAVRRVLAGLPLYGAPAIDYVPFLYPPVFFHAAALVARVTGEGFAAMRVVSLGATLVSFVLIARLANRGGTGRGAGLIAAGLFAASYAKSGAWFDLGRVDALFLALTLGAIAVLAGGRGFGRGAAAGVLFGVAYLTKQPAALIMLPFTVALAFEDRRGLAGLGLAFVVVAGGGHLALQQASGGWYSFYILELPRAHRIEPRAVAGFWLMDMLAPFAIAIAFSIAALLPGAKTKAGGGPERIARGGAITRERRIDLALAAGMLGAAWVSRMHEGGAENVLMPAHAALAILGARGFVRIAGASATASPARARVVLVLALVQFAVLAYNPLRYVPSRADAEAGTALTDRIRALPGDVWIPGHGYLATLAGKESHAHLMAVIDVLRAAPRSRPVSLQHDIEQAFVARRFTALVLDDNQAFEQHLGGLYRPAASWLGPGDRAFFPRSGAPLRPQTLWLPEPR